MDFASIRIITADVARLADFYERATGIAATWATADFAEINAPAATLAIAGTRTVPLFAPGSAQPGENRSVIIEFLVADVDAVHRNLTGVVPEFVTEPTMMPWGNRALLLRDPDGNLVNFFTPVTPEAIAKFAR
ncbi:MULTISPECIES: VOC family protein [unclassified Saccharopolyspora]|uniref:VOC family protein n=1 Tax=unclassified Saccharopolyspora TaxID=2646250 RepID=UPI001CD4744C|nr:MULTISPECIES: VOC family protein [unclassified Saccharopolyspora]MCA1195720.1 VOC family protein [Saccharopolyspora sp. 6V]MCA1229003.1 VOC family protein [Saccharopolyspora sp. 6M]MCA1282792.1 VOC family protein [Saccharopolyspora sp. 7B]